jgi:hypothetical protein
MGVEEEAGASVELASHGSRPSEASEIGWRSNQMARLTEARPSLSDCILADGRHSCVAGWPGQRPSRDQACAARVAADTQVRPSRWEKGLTSEMWPTFSSVQ